MAKGSASTIVDIAKELGVAPSTVSRALKDHPFISQETKDKVKKVAARLGYRRNALAAGLRNSHSNIIGLIVPRISMYFQSAVITAIQNTVHGMGYDLIICQSNDSYKQEMELVNALYGSRVEGLIVSCTMYTTDFSHFKIFTENQIPLVFYDRVPRNFPAYIIRGNDYEGGYLGGKHLLERGCKDIAFINGVLSCNLYLDRLEGLRAAMKEAKVPLKKNRVFSHELTVANAEETCKKIFSRKPYPDAVFCANDTTAIVALQYAKMLEIKVPQEFKVLGYSNDPRSEIISPALSSIEQFPAEMGERTAKAMLDLIHKKNYPKKAVESITPAKLVSREST
ncbi:MAG: LacI family transcriptional regulator [Chitinophagaceae bacterium]|nr:MAG: LacI family transcriptional regulator [Chitinophagaceae bacterium]